MVWDTIQNGAKKAVAFNHWPMPFNWMKNARTLMCNNDYWLAEFEFAFDLFANFFWTSFVPSPRELERKTFTGGYRCGFYLDVKVKSPLEIVFGNGTARMVGEIASPFATGLFYFWAVQTSFEAISVFSTIIFRQLLCDPFIGDVLRSNDRGVIEAGGSFGVPGLGDKLYDPRGLCEDAGPICHLPPGWTHAYAAYLFVSAGGGMTDIQTGWQREGVVVNVKHHGDVAPNTAKAVIDEISYFDADQNELAPWAGGYNGPGVIPGAVQLVRFILANDVIPPPNSNQPLVAPYTPQDADPKCVQSFF